MNRITLKRNTKFDGEKEVVSYDVVKVVGSTSPYVGENISQDYVRDLCEQTGTWTVTFI